MIVSTFLVAANLVGSTEPPVHSLTISLPPIEVSDDAGDTIQIDPSERANLDWSHVLFSPGLHHPEYLAHARRGLVSLREWDGYMQLFTSESRPSRSSAVTDLENPQDPHSRPGYMEPRIYRGTPFGSFFTQQGSPQTDESLSVSSFSKSVESRLRSILFFLERSADVDDLDLVEPVINKALFDLFHDVRGMHVSPSFECMAWIAILEQAHYRTVIHFAKRPGHWDVFSRDLTFVIRVLLRALQTNDD